MHKTLAAQRSHVLHESLCIVGALVVAADLVWHLAGWMHLFGR